ncbi:MAG: hypothetical protein LBB04_03170 [Oscillospiraceae bacterium]|jgi:hypothetical protein|nr:hypothetical protein [Oscillospiraceae bacterium]
MPLNASRRVGSALLAGCVMLSGLGNPCLEVVAAVPVLEMDSLVKLAIDADGKLASLKMKVAFQSIKRKRAQEAIEDIRKKESTVRFSLLLNIKLPEKHGLPKEIDLLTAVPKIDSETVRLEREIESRKRELKGKVEHAVVKCYELQERIKKLSQEIQDKTQKLKEMGGLVLLGKAQQKDMDALNASIDKRTRELASLKQSFERETTKLGSLTNQNLSGVIFKNPLVTCVIPREKRSQMIDYAMLRRSDVFEAEMDRKLECMMVDNIWGVYKRQWGSKVGALESAVRSKTPLDWDDVIRKYKDIFEKIDKPWAPVFKLCLIFFVLRIPMEWFKGEYDGTRYFDGEKYLLLESLQGRENARSREETTKKTVRESLENFDEAVREAYKAYEDAQIVCAMTKRTYETVKINNLLGLATFEETMQAEENYVLAQEDVQECLVSYNDAIIVLDEETCGWVTPFKKGKEILNEKTSVGNSLGLPKPCYVIENNIEFLQSTFKINIPKEAGISASDYELWVSDLRIGDKKPISEPMILLPVEIVGIKEVTVKLYDKDKFVDEANFDGLELSGDLEFKLAGTENALADDEAESRRREELLADDADLAPKQLGEYLIEDYTTVEQGTTLKKFRVLPESDEVKYFRIVVNYDKDPLTSDKIYEVSGAMLGFDVMFKDLSKIRVLLYGSKKELLYTAELDFVNGKLIMVD